MPRLSHADPPSTSSAPPARRSASFLGSLSRVRAPALGATAIKGALARARLAAGRGPGSLHGQRALRRHRPGAGAPGGDLRRDPEHAPDDHRRARSAARACRPSSSAPRPSRSATRTSSSPAAWSRCRTSPTTSRRRAPGYRMGNGKLVDGMIYDGLWDPVQQRPHGHRAATACAAEYKVSRDAQDEFAKESFRRALAAPEGGPLRRGDRAGERARRRRATRSSSRTTKARARATPTKFATLKPGVREGRDHHRRERLEHQRRRGGARPRERAGGQGAQARAARPHRRLRRRGPGARVVHHRARQGHRRDADAQLGLAKNDDRSLRDQRGVRGRRDGLRAPLRARPAARQRPRRRGRARAPHRRVAARAS